MSQNLPSYEEFLPKEDVCQFECDMEEGNYQKWVSVYPQHTLSIFGSLLSFKRKLSEEEFNFFVSKGVDLNQESNVYPSDTPLIFSCEYRIIQNIEYMIQLGVDINKRNKDGISPLESVLMGHGVFYLKKINDVKQCIKILEKAGVEKKIRKFIYDIENGYCEYYLKDEYLKNFIQSCELID